MDNQNAMLGNNVMLLTNNISFHVTRMRHPTPSRILRCTQTVDFKTFGETLLKST